MTLAARNRPSIDARVRRRPCFDRERLARAPLVVSRIRPPLLGRQALDGTKPGSDRLRRWLDVDDAAEVIAEVREAPDVREDGGQARRDRLERRQSKTLDARGHDVRLGGR